MSGVRGGAEAQMSKGGWARLMKQKQEQDSVQSKSDANDYQVPSIQYKNIISSKQPQHMDAKIYNTTACTVINAASTTSAASSLSATSPPPILQVAVHDHAEFRSSRLLQIVRRWKTQSGAKQITPRMDRSTTRSQSCSMLNFVPLSCITFSSIHLHSDLDDDDDDDDDDGNEIDIASDSCKKNAKIRFRRLHHRSRSAHTTRSTHKHTMKNTQCTGKGIDSPCERAPARRALSCPKLSSPLSSCTAFPSMDEQEGEELECLQPKQEEDHRVKLKRSSSSPLRRHNLLIKQPSTPKGYLALYVGEERRRFLVKANLLNHPLFSILLDKAKEEFGFDQKGGLNIPCDIAFFQHIMFLVESNDPSYKHTDHTSILLHFNSDNQLAPSVV